MRKIRPELKQKILKFNQARAADKAAAADLHTLLGALPPGQVKQLLKNEVCAGILGKYGITGE